MWNPVKELKVNSREHVIVHVAACVESGEGIES